MDDTIFATATFGLFLSEIRGFNVERNGKLDFEAKQRMLSRAQAVGTVEAYSLQGVEVFSHSTEKYLVLLEEAQKRIRKGGPKSTVDVRIVEREDSSEDSLRLGSIELVEYDPHREEIKTVLVAAVLQHVEARRMQLMSFAVAVLAAILGAIALFK